MKNIIVSSRLILDKYKNVNLVYDKDILYLLNELKLNKFPYINKKLKLAKNISDADGLILLGGGDLYKYHKTFENKLRDRFEKELLKKFIKTNKPILGICRGFQQIINFYGEKLEKKVGHVNKTHILKLNKNRFLSLNNLSVNSYHNYVITKLPKSFNLVSKYKDQSIEIAEHKKKKILCIMFHPERKMKSQQTVIKQLKKFFK